MGATLNTYLQQTQRFIRDSKQEIIDPGDLVDYINRARREIAMRSQCIRVLPPISGAVVSIPAPTGGGWTAPTVIISPPDYPSGVAPFPNGAQATATATAVAGEINTVGVNFGGSGYFQPTVTINDPTGTTASAAPVLSPFNQTIAGQEVYPFSAVDLSQFPGVAAIHAVKSVSIIYANYRYSLPQYSFSVYQAMIRQYPFQYQYVPTFCSQYGQGVGGSLYMYPLPSQAYQMEWDCFCLPQDLTDDQSVEVIPDPWTDGVPYMAAYFCYLEMQNMNAARAYLDLFTDFTHRYRTAASPGRVSNPYGRW